MGLERTLLLLKPDALEKACIGRFISSELHKFGLETISERKLVLTAADIEVMWPDFTSAGCPLTSRLLNKYLEGTVLNALLLEARDANARCNELKQLIRSKFRAGIFSNCVHSPSDAKEFQRQARLLFPAIEHAGAGEDNFVRLDSRFPIWGKLAEISPQELIHSADLVWASIKANGWERMWRWNLGDGDAELVLLDDDVHSIDYAASAVFELFPSLGVMSALSLVLEADRAGIAVLCRGAEQQTLRYRQMLSAWGLKARVVPSSSVGRGGAKSG